jgi:hypothetical protein
MKEEKIDGARSTHGGRDLKGRGHSEDLFVDGRLRKQVGRA